MRWLILLITFITISCDPRNPTPESEIEMSDTDIISALKGYLADSYPGIAIRIEPWRDDLSRDAIYFEHEKFAVLYPMQRYHYLIHSIPQDFYERHLSEAVWVELAPGETVDDLRYPDEELIKSISPDVLKALQGSGFFAGLDDLMSPEDEAFTPEVCHGDFRHAKRVLAEKGFGERDGIDEVFDICHVLMDAGGYCDCEILYNVSEQNRLKAAYWKKRAENPEAEQGVGGNGGHAH